MPKSLEEFIQDCGKPKNLKDYVVNGWNCVTEKVQNGVRWIVEHPEETAVYTTLGAGLMSLFKKGIRYVTARRETYNKERYVYDHSAGQWLKTRRVLDNNDVVRINELRRKNPGMKMAEAMARLNLLD